MPWVLLLRWLVRVAVGLAFWRVAAARRRGRTSSAPPVRGAPARSRIDRRAAAAALREGASIGWRALSAVIFLIAAAVLITAGVTTTVLSPRWLGGVLLGLALTCLVLAALEIRAVVRVLAARRRRRHDQELRSQLS